MVKPPTGQTDKWSNRLIIKTAYWSNRKWSNRLLIKPQNGQTAKWSNRLLFKTAYCLKHLTVKTCSLVKTTAWSKPPAGQNRLPVKTACCWSKPPAAGQTARRSNPAAPVRQADRPVRHQPLVQTHESSNSRAFLGSVHSQVRQADRPARHQPLGRFKIV